VLNSLPIIFKLKINRKKINLVLLIIIAIFWLLNSLASDQPIQDTNQPVVPTGDIQVLGTTVATSAANLVTKQVASVAAVIDGDTIKLTDGRKLRYIGIDTPETKDPHRGIGCFGQQATNKNKELVEGKTIEIEKDVSETDRYSRLLRYVYVDGVMINELLVKEGFAKASSYPPDIKYQNIFTQAQKQAEFEKKGLWSDICNPTPTVLPTN